MELADVLRAGERCHRMILAVRGRFVDWGTQSNGRLWLFANTKDQISLDDALNTFRDSLRVLQNNTQ
jgi:hypothetical protein